MYNVLALNGGGMRGALHVGALKRISEQYNEEYLYKIFHKGIYGISIGAILGCLVAFGFSTSEISDILFQFSNVNDIFEPICIQKCMNVQHRRGIDNGSKLFEFLIRIFQKKNLDLHTLRVKHANVPLYIIASDLTNIKPVWFGGDAYLWDALRSSFALPIIFTPHVIGKTTYVDGAILCENISTAIPKEDLSTTLFSLCYSYNPKDYLFILLNCRSIKEIRKIHKKYPNNTCVLVENDTPLFFFKDIPNTFIYLSDTGYSCMDQFFSSGPSAEIRNSLNTGTSAGPS